MEAAGARLLIAGCELGWNQRIVDPLLTRLLVSRRGTPPGVDATTSEGVNLPPAARNVEELETANA
jgi:hypothetical protein